MFCGRLSRLLLAGWLRPGATIYPAYTPYTVSGGQTGRGGKFPVLLYLYGGSERRNALACGESNFAGG